MKLTNFYLIGALAISALSPAVTLTMEAPQQPQAQVATSNDEQAAICPICFAELNNGEDKRTLPCHPKHIFHRACINTWLQTRPNCPMCQTHITPPPLTKREQFNRNLIIFNRRYNPLKNKEGAIISLLGSAFLLMASGNLKFNIKFLSKTLKNAAIFYIGTIFFTYHRVNDYSLLYYMAFIFLIGHQSGFFSNRN